MKTDWNLIRETMNSVIDACEAVEQLELTEADRDAPTSACSVFDVLYSSWSYPENVMYDVVRARHELGEDKHYTPEAARALVNVARVCAELVGASHNDVIQTPVRQMANWYPEQMVPQITRAMEAKQKGSIG